MENEKKNYESNEVVHQKNEIIINQNRRIKMLEDKLDEVRNKYFCLKRFVSLMGYSK
jgi:hypothetical protein